MSGARIFGRTIKGVAFDLEGTVVDVEFAHHQGHILAAEEVGVYLDLETALKKIPHLIGGPDDEIAKEICEISDKGKSASFILERTKYHYKQLLATIEAIEPRPGFQQILKRLREFGLGTAIGSLTSSEEANILLEKSSLRNLFKKEEIVLREDVKRPKPAPDVFLETARRMGINPTEQLVFEDSPNGIIAAREAGSRAIAVPVYNLPEVLTRLANAGAENIYTDWREIDIENLISKEGSIYLGKERERF